jgi:hypothetical protein
MKLVESLAICLILTKSKRVEDEEGRKDRAGNERGERA